MGGSKAGKMSKTEINVQEKGRKTYLVTSTAPKATEAGETNVTVNFFRRDFPEVPEIAYERGWPKPFSAQCPCACCCKEKEPGCLDKLCLAMVSCCPQTAKEPEFYERVSTGEL